MVEGEVPERAQQIVPDPSEADFASFMSDLSNSTKNGYLFMQDPIDKVKGSWWEKSALSVLFYCTISIYWGPYDKFFVLRISITYM